MRAEMKTGARMIDGFREQRVGSGMKKNPTNGCSWLFTFVGAACLLVGAACLPGEASADDAALDFRTQIAPVFQRHCIRCHSPDDNKGDVSLATFDDLKHNEYVIPGDPDDSSLLDLVSSVDGDPPEMPKDSEPLSSQEVARLRRWIAEGSKWPSDVVVQANSKADASWWSLQPINAADHAADDAETLNIDGFIDEKLAEQGLKRSSPADRRTLIRRLSFDLHGLPPTPEAVEAFVDDPDQNAYEKLVDRMLHSPNYGERFTQHWLDIAHYADTHGFERDQRRDNAWRYRDYVIDSLNDDKPYDRFLQEQIAGDVLWPDDEQAIIATGFLAAGPWDFVGQVETESEAQRRGARSLDLDDMATQVMTATVAMTVNCARCHDHKLDPISQQEYYQLRAVFAGVKRSDRAVSDTAIQKYDADKAQLTSRLNQIDFEIGRIEGKSRDLADIVGGGLGLGTGIENNGIDPRNAKVRVRNFGNLPEVTTNRFAKSGFPFVDGVFIPDGEDVKTEVVVSSTGITVTGLPKTSGKAWDTIRNGPVGNQHSTVLGGIDFTADGHSLLSLHANAGITFDLAAIRKATDTAGMRFTASLGYFGAKGDFQADVWVYVDGRKAFESRHLRRQDALQQVNVDLPVGARFLTLVSTDGGNGISHDQVGFGDPKLQSIIPRELNAESQQRVARLRDDRRPVADQLAALGPSPRFYGVVPVAELPEVRLLVRGNSESPSGPTLAPAAMGSLAMLDPKLETRQSGEGQRRAALSRWITHPDNPLTRRVIVNRLWQWHFGQGMVDTPSDFGFGGGRPSHPELLDWLAAELVRQNWSLKAMHRLICTSATYRQRSRIVAEDGAPRSVSDRDQAASSTPPVDPLDVDADNRLLWRQNPRRIEAEAIRDAVLFVSGKLNPKRGGPGFEDFKYLEAYAPIYTYVTADSPPLWRRSIYRYRVRTSPNRFLTTLDCADPANLTPKRFTTTTPLQSLALYNNEFMLRQSRYFAERIEMESESNDRDRVRRAFQLALGRKPTPQEAGLATEFVARQGLFALCRSLFNVNEFVYLD